MLGESENQFSLTRAALSTCGRAKSKFLSVGAVALLLLLPVACWAGGMVTNCTEAALRAAMAGGGTVRFACDGTITLASTISNGVNVTLDGTGHQVTISGSGGSFVRIFCVNSNVNLTLINLTIMGGGGSSTMGGGILNSGGTVNATGVAFTQNEVSVAGPGECFGGAIYNDQLGTLNLQGCSFTMNGAHAVGSYGVAFGGAIYNGGTMNASACMFDDNVAGCPPAQYSGFNAGGNAAGGAVYNLGVAVIEGSIFSYNYTYGGPGVFLIGPPKPSQPSDGPPGGTGRGGAICNLGGLIVRTSSFCKSSASGGIGAAGFGPGYPTQGGAGGRGANAYGGAVDNEGTASIESSAFDYNVAYAGDGGAGGAGGGPGGAGGDAEHGAVFNVALVNCFLTANSARAGAGGPGTPYGANGTATGDPDDGSAMPALAISRSGATGVTVLAIGNLGQTYRLLWSPDMSSWVPLATNQVGMQGAVLFNDTCIPGSACRFYRLVTP